MIGKLLRALSVACSLSTAILCGAASAQTQYSSITVFGDSLSDPGNIPRFFGLNLPAPPYFQNQFSNGPIYAKYLNGLFGIATPLNDFAIGGAQTGAGNISGLPGNPALGLPNSGIDGEISLYLAGAPAPSKRDLFIVWGGANDYFNTVPTLGPLGLSGGALRGYLTGPTGPVTQTVGNLVTDIARLARAGVKNFVVPNLPNLGSTPDYNGNPVTSAQATLLAATHNQALAQAMGQLQQQLHVNITIVDIGAVFNDILANPAKYGFDPNHITDQCILSPTCVAQHQNYLFWDGVHPTGLAQQELSEVFLSSLDGPTTVGAEIDMNEIVQQDLFDHISARTAALRLGAAGLIVSNVGGASGTVDGDSDKPLAAFITDSYGWGNRDSRQNVDGFDYRQNNTTAGLDYRVNDWLAVGGLIGYGETSGDLQNGLGAQSFNSYEAAIYATAFSGGWYGSLAGTYTYNDWDTLNRNVFVGGQTAAAATGGHVWGAKLEGGYVLHQGSWSFGPSAELRIADYRIGSYTERGAVGLNQEVDSQTASSMVGQFGIQAALTTAIGTYAVIPQLRVDFDHEFRNATRAIVTRIASQPATSVTTDLAPGTDNWVRIGGGVDVQLTRMFSALVDFDTSVGRSGGEDYSALARLKAVF